MKKVLFVLLVVVFSVFAMAEKVTVQIEGSAVPYYVPMFMGIELGYFKAEGLDVDYFFGSASDIVRNVAVGNVEFGFPNGEPVITALSQDIPVNVIHTTYQHGLGSTLFLKDSGITTPADLKGKKIAVTSYGSSNYVQLQVLLKKNGMTLDDIDLQIIGTEAIVPALVNKRVDAICFSMLRTFELAYQGIEVGEFRSDEFLPSFGNVVITGDKLLKDNRELAVRFTRALSRVMAYLSDPENMKTAAALTIEKYSPTYAGREDYIAAVLSEVYAGYLWQSADTAAFGFGFGNVEKWQNSIDLMKEYDIIKKDVKATDFVIPRL